MLCDQHQLLMKFEAEAVGALYMKHCCACSILGNKVGQISDLSWDDVLPHQLQMLEERCV